MRELDAHVEAALALLTNAHDHYRLMDGQGRQLMNQAVAAQLAPDPASNALLERFEVLAPYLAERLRHRRSEPIPGHK